MKAIIEPCILNGKIDAPASKSLSHRFLICAALSKKKCKISNILLSDDIKATINCLTNLGASIMIDGSTVIVDGSDFLTTINPNLNCNESGSTLRFFIPMALLLNQEVNFIGSKRLFERPLDVYEDICKRNNFLFNKTEDSLTVKGQLKETEYTVVGNISSQFITGLLFALSTFNKECVIHVLPPFESKSYVLLTIQSLREFGINVEIKENNIYVYPSSFVGKDVVVEADESNAAFLDAYNFIGSNIKVNGLNPYTLQGDSVYHKLFPQFLNATPEIDIKDCPDLGPVLMALGALNKGVILNNTSRLKAKECDRGLAMKQELEKYGSHVTVYDNKISVSPCLFAGSRVEIDSHNDHRIVMSMALVCSRYGGIIHNAEAINKSFPNYFDKIMKLNGKVKLV